MAFSKEFNICVLVHLGMVNWFGDIIGPTSTSTKSFKFETLICIKNENIYYYERFENFQTIFE